jgi:hypothetical protein
MLRIGVTGHTDLSPAAQVQVRDGMRAAIRRLAAGHRGQLRGVSCLAPGADTIFAEVVLELGGAIEVVLPAQDYRQTLSPERIEEFDRLVACASTVDYMQHRRSGIRAFRSANAEMLRRSTHLIAVWNGAAPSNPGGTGEVVGKARAAGIPVEVISVVSVPIDEPGPLAFPGDRSTDGA